MKNISKILVILFLNWLLACSDAKPPIPVPAKTDSLDVVVNIPFKNLSQSTNWIPGNPRNAVVVLNAMRAYENGNIEEVAKAYADSVRWLSDRIEKKLSHDSLKAMLKKIRGAMKKLEFRMDDWQSVISKDKKQQFVSIWYGQYWQDNEGLKDSLFFMTDFSIENGKISGVDEKQRRFAKKEK